MANYIFKRVEKKYLIDTDTLAMIMAEIKERIKLDEYTGYSIFNIYYDTVDNRLITKSIEKTVYKEKLRVRSYGTPSKAQDVFVEIKKKYDGVVYKRRMCIANNLVPSYLRGIDVGIEKNQISREIDYFVNFYEPVPKLFIAYERDCYTGITDKDLRITVDKNIRSREHNLELSYGGEGKYLLERNLRLVEIKTETAYPMWLTSVLNKYKVYPTSFSKYGNIYKDNFSRKKDYELKEVI